MNSTAPTPSRPSSSGLLRRSTRASARGVRAAQGARDTARRHARGVGAGQPAPVPRQDALPARIGRAPAEGLSPDQRRQIKSAKSGVDSPRQWQPPLSNRLVEMKLSVAAAVGVGILALGMAIGKRMS
eukprot:scaffold52532_cov68-Phaeocystis_antarctica.AAC.2